MRRYGDQAFTLVEVLIALAVIGIAFGALALVQVTNLRAGTTARFATDVKTAANRVLEQQTAIVLARSGGDFAFTDFYSQCVPDATGKPSTASGCQGAYTPFVVVPATSTEAGETPAVTLPVNVTYAISTVPGIVGEGVLSISVTATHVTNRSIQLTIGDRITCYDVYPTPTNDTPEPCPVPAAPPVGG